MGQTMINRRSYLKKSAFSLGAAMLASHIGISESILPSISRDSENNFAYSPFFKEFIPSSFNPNAPLLAKLNANENPHGPSPNAMKALKENLNTSNRYAWKELYSLVDMLAEKEGVTPKHVFMGPGSSDILEKTAMIYFKDGGNVVSADPAYMSLVKVAKATGASWKSVPLKDDWSHDLDAMEAAIDNETKLVYICNPNNPTGTITDSAELKEFCKRVSKKTTLFVDEAYLDFMEGGNTKSMVSLVDEGYDVIVARTFSKIHGMAGLRVGYAIATEETLSKFRVITRGGMGISHPAVSAAKASLADFAFLQKSKMLNTEAREYTFSTLKSAGFDPVTSHTSFMIFPIEMEGKAFLDQMYEQQVAVRSFQFFDKTWCRVSMGTMNEMKTFTETIQKVLV